MSRMARDHGGRARRKDGAMANEEVRAGRCHCGAVRFNVRLADGLTSARRCDCSYCAARGAVAVTAMRGDLKVTDGADRLTLYQFGTGTAEHYFCAVCGIYTHHRRRSNPDELGVNVACLEGLSPFDFDHVVVNDGQTHPNDRPPGAGTRQAGVLIYKRHQR